MIEKKDIEEYYIMALMDIAAGASIEDMEEVIQEYEKAEMYEACAGILKAIHETKYYTINNIKKKTNGNTRDN